MATRTVDPTLDSPAERPLTAEEIVFGAANEITIHFLTDGFTALERIWYRGQELTFKRGSQEFKDTCDRNGHSWLQFAHDEAAQVERYRGKLYFRLGPWPGQPWKGDAGEKEQKRSRRPPLLPGKPTSRQELGLKDLPDEEPSAEEE